MWVKQGINAWMTAAGIEEGRLLRRIRKGGHIGESLSDWAVWSVVMESAREIGIERFGGSRPPPHLRQALPESRRRPRTDQISARALVHPDDGTIPRLRAGDRRSGERRLGTVKLAYDAGLKKKVDTVEWRSLRCSPLEDSVQCSFKRLRSTTLLQNIAPIGPCCFQFGIVGRCRYTPSVI